VLLNISILILVFDLNSVVYEDSCLIVLRLVIDYHIVYRHFCTVDAVLHGARHMVAMEIASDPTVRQVIRRAFRERAILSVRPTKKGKKVRAICSRF